MGNKDIEQDDVKEYKPRKRKNSGRTMVNNNISPSSSDEMMSDKGIGYDEKDLTGGVMLSTSEIIDFSEGTDSWVNQQ